jgi:hypothetical protein
MYPQRCFIATPTLKRSEMVNKAAIAVSHKGTQTTTHPATTLWNVSTFVHVLCGGGIPRAPCEESLQLLPMKGTQLCGVAFLGLEG